MAKSRLTPKNILDKKGAKEKITALTAYDFPFARMIDAAGLDIVLVGDSLGMVVLGHESTISVTMRDMLHHTKAVVRAVTHALVVADMPYGSYASPEQALRNAKRFMQEAGAGAVKLEGGQRVEKQVRRLTGAQIPVMGHVGMTPQSADLLGGYKVQGKTSREAEEIIKDAVLLDRLGAFAIVLECIPAKLGAEITKKVKCPTIGIGAGAACDGQVMVLHDMLGFESKVSPRFVRRYASLGEDVRGAASRFVKDVQAGKYPAEKESY